MGNTILVVDDSLTLRKVLSMRLKSAGYSLELAEDGPRAVEAAINQMPELILLDHQLPGYDGPEVCRKLLDNEQTATIPVIIASGVQEEQFKVYADLPNVVGKLPKPFTPQELYKQVEQGLAMREQIAQKIAASKAQAAEPSAQVEAPNLAAVILMERHDAAESVRQALQEGLKEVGLPKERYAIRLAATPAMGKLLIRKLSPQLLVFSMGTSPLASLVETLPDLDGRFTIGLIPMDGSEIEERQADEMWSLPLKRATVQQTLRRLLFELGVLEPEDDQERTLTRLVRQSRQSLNEGQADRALELLEQADAISAPDERRKKLREEISEALVGSLRTQAEQAIQREDYEKAEQLLEKGQKLAPEDPSWAEPLKQVKGSLNQGRAKQLLQQAEQALEQDDAEQAEQLLDQAHELAPRHGRIAELRQETQRRRRRLKVQELLQRCDDLLARGDLQRVEALLAQAEELEPQWEQTAALRRRLRERQRGDQVVEMQRRARSLADQGKFNEALEVLREAQNLNESDRDTNELIAEMSSQMLDQRVDKIFAEARQLAEQRRLKEAQQKLREAQSLDPNRPETVDLLDQISERSLEEDIRSQHQQAMELADKGDMGAALRQLREAYLMDSTRQDTNQLIEEYTRRQRQQQVEQLLADASSLANGGDFDEAVRKLREAQEIDPDRRDIQQRLDGLLERSRQLEIELLHEQIEQAMEEQRYEDGLRLIKRAQAIEPENDKTHEYAQQLELMMLDENIDQLLDEAQQLMEEGRLDAALTKLKDAQSLDDSRADTHEMLEIVEERIHLRDAAEMFDSAQRQLNQGDVPGAVRLLEKAQVRAPQRADITQMLQVCRRQLEREEAQAQGQADEELGLDDLQPDDLPDYVEGMQITYDHGQTVILWPEDQRSDEAEDEEAAGAQARSRDDAE